MLKKTFVVLAAASLAMIASPASADDDVVGLLNQSNLSVLPIQLCSSNVALGVVAVNLPLISPQETGHCTNAPQVNVQPGHGHPGHPGHPGGPAPAPLPHRG